MRKQEDPIMENIEPTEGAELAHRLARSWVEEAGLLPLSILALDHPPPVSGWQALLEARGIALVQDDLYRPAIRREDARRLVEERREWERTSAEKARRRREQMDVPRPVARGVPALEGATPFESMAAAGGVVTPAEEFGGRGRGSVTTQLLDERLAEGRRRERDKGPLSEEEK